MQSSDSAGYSFFRGAALMRAVLIMIWPCTTLAQPQVDKIEDLRARAVEVRSINSGDEDFSDLVCCSTLARIIHEAR